MWCKMMPLPGSEGIFGLVWPLPFTSWPPKLTISCPCSTDHLSQFASKLVHSFSKYCVDKFGNRRLNRKRMDEEADKLRISCLLLLAWPGGGIKIAGLFVSGHNIYFKHQREINNSSRKTWHHAETTQNANCEEILDRTFGLCMTKNLNRQYK